MKACGKCWIDQNTSNFYEREDSIDGLQHTCKECMKKYSKNYRKENPESVKENLERYMKENREKVNARNKAWRERNPNYFSDLYKKKKVKDGLSHSTHRGVDQ